MKVWRSFNFKNVAFWHGTFDFTVLCDEENSDKPHSVL